MPGEESTSNSNWRYQQLGQLKLFSGDSKTHAIFTGVPTRGREIRQQKPDDPVSQPASAATYVGLGYVQLNSLEMDKTVQSLRAALQVFGTEPNGNEDHGQMLVLFIPARDLA